jgi:large repetitive protein
MFGGSVRPRRRLRGYWRRTAMVAVASLALVVAAPAGDVMTGTRDRLPLAWLWSWLSVEPGWAAPSTPRQESAGTAVGKAHTVPAAATRVGRGSGRPPGKGIGELPAYVPRAPQHTPAKWTPAKASTASAHAEAAGRPQITGLYPPQNQQVTTLTPELVAAGTDSAQPNAALQYQFAVFDSDGAQVAVSSLLPVGIWQVPAGKLVWGKPYAWVVAAFNGTVWGDASPASYFFTAVPQPPVTSRLSQNSGGRGIEPNIGNYTTSSTDAQVPTVGPALTVVRSYNSLDPRTSGAFGAGWSSVFDGRAAEDKDAAGALRSVVISYPDGQQVAFGRNPDGSFVPPSGRYSTLRAAAGGGYTLADKNNTTFAFTRAAGAGQFLITSITDASGRIERFGYNAAGQLETVTSASGRALRVNWYPPSPSGAVHVRSVETDPAIAGDPMSVKSYRYTYTGDQLSSVCPPISATACVHYDYTAVSEYPSTAADLGPRSYWRLGESSGTVAASSVLANAGSDNATYANVTLGQPGPLAGSAATAASFNGTSSNVVLRPGLVTNASYQTISLWFKTSTPNGVLFSYQADPIGNGTTAGNYVPALYVGGSGKLYGKFWTQPPSAPVVTDNPVTDGKWHHVVLTGGGNIQTMYLDGAPVRSGSGTIALYNANGANNAYLGAGFIGGTWPDQPHQSGTDNTGYAEYFTGQIAEASFYDRWLAGSDVAALFGAGHAAVQALSTVTRPSGNTAVTVAYDQTSGRVSQLTDGNGGVWKVAPPTVSGSSRVYASAVMGAGPVDYWRLGDASGPVAVNVVHGGTATYNGVTLGASGPFADASAASFDGGSSALRLPGGLLPGSGTMSVSAWFNTTQTGGVLLGEQAQGLGATNGAASPALWIGPDGTLRGSVPATTPTGPMVGMANKCLDLNGFGTNNGTKVQLWTCTGAANQVWQPTPEGKLRNPVSGRCLDVSAGGTANASIVWLWDCIPNATNQEWRPQPDGSWKNPVSGRCLDLANPSTADGTQAFIYDCYSGAGQKWKASLASPAAVNDGKWHHAVLTGDGTNQALYVDGNRVGSSAGPTLTSVAQPYVYVGTGRTGTGTGTAWNGLPAGTDAYFQGSVADVAVYPSALSSAQVTGQFAASKSSTGLTPVQTVTITDPGGKTLRYEYDAAQSSRLIASTDGLGYTTRYGYDTGGFVHTSTDPNGNVTTTGHDVRGNLVSQTTCQNQTTNACATAYFTYFPDATTANLTPDARNDLLLTTRDPRSASATDPAYLTTYGYDTGGNRTTVTTPPVPGFPNGRTTTTTYTDGTTVVATDGGFAPAGLPWKTTTPGGAVKTNSYFHNGDVAQVTDAIGLVTKYTYDNLGRPSTQTTISDTYPAGLVATYDFDGLNRLRSQTAPPVTDRVTGAVHTAKTTTVRDDDGNVTSRTLVDLTGGDASRAISATFNGHDQQITATDAAHKTTTFGYDDYGNKTVVIDPTGTETDTAFDPNGQPLTVTLKAYTGDPVNPSRPKDLVLASHSYDPAGRRASVTDSMGWVTSFTYFDNGLHATTVRSDPSRPGTSFLQESDSYDAAGNLTAKQTNNGATTTTATVDAAGRSVSSTVDPAGVNRTTSNVYSPDDYVLSTTVADAAGASVVDATYDPLGRPTSKTVHVAGGGQPNQWWKLTDSSGTSAANSAAGGQPATATNLTWQGDGAGFNGTNSNLLLPSNVVSTTGNQSVSLWFKTSTGPGVLLSYSRDPIGNATTPNVYTAALYVGTDGHLLGQFEYDDAGVRPISSAGSVADGKWHHVVLTAAGEYQTLYLDGALVGGKEGLLGSAPSRTANAYVGAGFLGGGWPDEPHFNQSDNTGFATYFTGSISNVQLYPRALTAAEAATLNTNGRTGAALTNTVLTTRTLYDQRGLPRAAFDANGNRTGYTYDEAGRLVATVAPIVRAETVDAPPIATHPVTTVGYDTFGAAVETTDPLGNESITAYDAAGRPVSVRLPDYTPPGATAPIKAVTSKTYDDLGRVETVTDPLHHQTIYTYDQLSNLATATAPDHGVTHHVYDTEGDLLSTTDPTGAVTEATYDYLGRKETSTQVVRQPTPTANVTNYAYNTPGGWLSVLTTPAGSTTAYGYNNAGETSTVTDRANNTIRYGYDYTGRKVRTTMPDGNVETTTFDAAGRPVASRTLDPAGTTLATGSATYDADGHRLSTTDARGSTTRFTYDASGLLTSETQPVSAGKNITTGFGYDAARNRTRFTDGRGNAFLTAYNTWNLPKSTIEPATPAYPALADRTYVTGYDAAGRVATQTAPGGVTVVNTYDDAGNLRTQTGSGADAPTVDRTFGYDFAGRMTSASAPGGTDIFGYDDRGLLLTTNGPSGTSSFTYTLDGLMATRTDAAGTATYTYDTTDRLKTLTDAATGTELTYTYNTLSQISTISYGASGDTRTLGYDPLHRLASDKLATPAGATVATITYGYDLNGNETSKTTTGFAGSATNIYTYDLADRLASWKAGTTTTAYAYDDAGNRTQNGSQTFAYDARNRLTGGGGSTYTYTARGTLAAVTTGSATVTSKSDAFGQTINQDKQTYTYDALGRVVTDATAGSGTRTLVYTGTDNTLAADGDATYGRDPAGGLVGVKAGATAVLAWTDRHTDVVADFTANATSLVGSTTYDPLGKILTSTGAVGNLGYQSGWTEPATAHVNMAARWYNTATGQFDNRDSAGNNPVPASVNANRYAYGNANPLTNTDPTGHRAWDIENDHIVYKMPSDNGGNDVCWGCEQAHGRYNRNHKPYKSPYQSPQHASWPTRQSSLTVKTETSRDCGSDLYCNISLKNQIDDIKQKQNQRYDDALAKCYTSRCEQHVNALAASGAYSWVDRGDGTYVTTDGSVLVTVTDNDRVAAIAAKREADQKAAACKKNFWCHAGQWVKDHASQIVGFVAGAVVGAIVGGICTAATGGVLTLGCAVLAGAVGGAVSGAVSHGMDVANGKADGGWGGWLGAVGGGAIAGAAGAAVGFGAGGLVGNVLGSAARAAASNVVQRVAVAAVAGAVTGAVAGGAAAAAGYGFGCLTGAQCTGAGLANAVAGGAAIGGAFGAVGGGFAGLKGRPNTPAPPSCKNSFDPATPVLMADGSTKRIDAVRVGDQVTATDPIYGKTAAEPVTQLHLNRDTDLTDLALASTPAAAGSVVARATVHTTAHHPFWDATDQAWVNAADLRFGHRLVGARGEAEYVVGVRTFVDAKYMHNLTIANLHTYYVLAGSTPVLVHNCPTGDVEYGPFHRRASSSHSERTTQDIINSDELWGHTGAYEMEPAVHAHVGPLPDEYEGVEFYTNVPPNKGPLAVGRANWDLGNPGVLSREGGDAAGIPIRITKVRHGDINWPADDE